MDETTLHLHQHKFWVRTLFPFSLFITAVISLFVFDAPLGAFFQSAKLSGEIRHLFEAAEHFGTPYGQILGLLCVAAASGWQEPRIFRIFCGAALAGLTANLGKVCIARIRPSQFDFEQHSILESFVQWFPLGSGGSSLQSFPSAHTASAFGFAALLSWAFPKGKVMFVGMAGLVALQRIVASAHYPSDVLVGGAIGWLVGLFLVGRNPIACRFDRIESRIRNHATPLDSSQDVA